MNNPPYFEERGRRMGETVSTRRLGRLGLLVRTLQAGGAGLCLLLLLTAFWPVRSDEENGYRGTLPSLGGLFRPFPAMPMRAENPIKSDRVALGKLLFFDPVLSGDNSISCATCHHPDMGFTDGRALSMGAGGKGLGPERAGGAVIRRSAPTVWNAAYNHRQFWDGRAADLEEQARGPITSEKEMNQDPQQLVKELRAIPEYVKKFDEIFGGKDGESISLDTATQAIAAFERTLLSKNSRFDRYVAGEVGVLSLSERRGLNLFRSGKARCFECHGFPTFANPDFKVVGIKDVEGMEPDLGRAEVTGGKGYEHAFKVPTLRNVALTAPYMHNGSLKTLEDVLDFYSKGGGHGLGVNIPTIDDKIRPFTLTAEEKADLIAFLFSLTDESQLPEFPPSVPSGLTVVGRLNNPARERVKAADAAVAAVASGRTETLITVKPGESIQAAVDRLQPGGTIELMPGTYHEAVTIDLPGVTLRGIKEDNRLPVLDGEGKLSDAIIASGRNFTFENFEMRNYAGNGITVSGATDVKFRDLVVDNTGLYGVYPVECSGVLVERVRVSRVRDAGIYVGQSEHIVVRDNEVYGNVTGIEIENSVDAIVTNNNAHGNTAGILVFVLPNNPSKVGRDTRVMGNRVMANNHENFADKGAVVSHVPQGAGIIIMAADRTEVTDNEIRDNNSFGIAVFGLNSLYPKANRFDVGPTPEENLIHNNRFENNGKKPDAAIVAAGIKGSDLIWDGSGWNNSWKEAEATSMPMMLPNTSWPGPVRRAFWRLISLVV
jgi:cytochrome c peroxidase